MQKGAVVDEIGCHAAEDEEELEEAHEKAANGAWGVFGDVCWCEHCSCTKTNAFNESTAVNI